MNGDHLPHRNDFAPSPIMSERRVTLIGASLAMIGPVSMSIFTPAMPALVGDFDTTETVVKLTLTVYFAGFALTQLVCGPLSDGVGRRPVTIGFMLVFCLASIAALAAPTIELLIVARFLQGVGAAVGVAMSRALVRDLFSGERAVRVLNLVGIILAIGPAAAPTLGGLTLAFAGWRAIFVLMTALGACIVAMALFLMRETVRRDLTRIRPLALLASWRELLRSRYFISASLTFAVCVGGIYAQATLLPFILMDRAGLSPAAFGLAMLAQSLSYLAGATALRILLPRCGSRRLVGAGVAMVAAASIVMAIVLNALPPSFLSVMGPVAIYAFGMAFLTATMMTAAMAPFGRIAGAAAAMGGFLQMGAGLIGSLVGALIGDPVLAMSVVIPSMGTVTTVAWAVWRRLPGPPPQGSDPLPPLAAGTGV